MLLLGQAECFSRTVTIESSQYSIDENRKLFQYTHGRLILDSMEISASKIVYQQDEQLFKFENDIFINSQDTLILAAKGTYSVKSRELILFDVSFFDQTGKTYIIAEKIERITGNKFIIHNGTFTSCNPKTPAWEIESEYVLYEMDNIATAFKTSIWLYSIPIFYTPAITWPTTKKRGSGFLAPSYNRVDSDNKSKSYGNRLKIPYFINLDQEHDLTITLDVIQQRGNAVDLEYQYAFDEGMKGQFLAWYLDETQSRDLYEEETGNTELEELDKSPERYFYSIDHKQDIFLNGQLFFHQNGNSDNEVNKEYFDSGVTLDARYSRSLDTIFQWDSGSISYRHEDGEDFLYQSVYDKESNVKTKVHKQPSITFNQSFSNLLGSSLSIGIQDIWTDYEVQYGWEGVIDQTKIDVKYPFSIDFLNFIPQYSKTYYEFDLDYKPEFESDSELDSEYFDQKLDSFGWFIDTKKLEMNFELFRYFKNLDDVNTGKLVIVPKTTFYQITEVDQTRIEILSETSAQDNVVYGLSFYYLSKDIKTANIKKVFQLDLSQAHNYYHPESDTETEDSEENEEEVFKNGEEEVLPLEITFSLFPSDRFSAKLFYRYDEEQNKVLETRASVTNTSEFGDSMSLIYTNNTETYLELDGTSVPIAKVYTIDGFFNISPTIKLNLSGNWDLNRHAAYRYQSTGIERLDRELVSGVVALTFLHDCYWVKLGYIEDISTQTIDGNTREYLDKRISLNFSINEFDLSNIYGLKYADKKLSLE